MNSAPFLCLKPYCKRERSRQLTLFIHGMPGQSNNMHKMHKKSAVPGHMSTMQNTFFNFSKKFVAYLEFIYYNGKDYSRKDFNIKEIQG